MTPLYHRRLAGAALATLAGLLLTAPFSAADTLYLHSGETIRGTVLDQAGDSVTIEVNFTESIKEDKVYPKSQIARIEITPPDMLAFEELKNHFPLPDGASTADYDEVIDNRLRLWLTSHPTSDAVPEVDRMLTTAREERDKVAKGWVRIDQRWYSPEEYSREEYNLEAASVFNGLTDQIASNDIISALRTFDTMEAEYRGSVHFPTAVESVRGAIPNFRIIVDGMIERQPILQMQREQGLSRQLDIDRPKIQAAIDAEIARHEAAKVRETEQGYRWLSIYPYDLEGLTALKDQLKGEVERVAEFDVGSLKNGAAIAALVMENIADKEYDTAALLIEQARNTGGDTILLDRLEAKIADLRAEAIAAAEIRAASEESRNRTRRTIDGILVDDPEGEGPDGEAPEGEGEGTAPESVGEGAGEGEPSPPADPPAEDDGGEVGFSDPAPADVPDPVTPPAAGDNAESDPPAGDPEAPAPPEVATEDPPEEVEEPAPERRPPPPSADDEGGLPLWNKALIALAVVMLISIGVMKFLGAGGKGKKE